MRAASAAGARTLAMVNVEDAPLAAEADWVLPLRAGPERSVAATKSFLATMAACLSLAAAWGNDADLGRALERLPDGLDAAWACDWSPLVEQLAPARGLYVIGRGPGFGAAQEMALKLKETCGLHAEAFSAAEVRHGPMALVNRDFPLLVLRQDDAAAPATDALVADMRAQGAPVLVAGRDLPLPPSDPVTAPVLAVQAFYRAANALSLARGLHPDRPPLLNKVTETV
jgi:glucosamine--fructose-6-phosphate aminotransferase (isomerizing)